MSTDVSSPPATSGSSKTQATSSDAASQKELTKEEQLDEAIRKRQVTDSKRVAADIRLRAAKERLDGAAWSYQLRRQVGAGTWQLFLHDPNGAKVELDFAPTETLD